MQEDHLDIEAELGIELPKSDAEDEDDEDEEEQQQQEGGEPAAPPGPAAAGKPAQPQLSKKASCRFLAFFVSCVPACLGGAALRCLVGWLPGCCSDSHWGQRNTRPDNSVLAAFVFGGALTASLQHALGAGGA